LRGLASLLGGGGDGAGGAPGAGEQNFAGNGGVNPKGSLEPDLDKYLAMGGDVLIFRRVNMAYARTTEREALLKAYQQTR
jgi:hypothetical protein